MVWLTPQHLFWVGSVWCPISIIFNQAIWFMGRNVSKLNKPGQLFIWTMIRECAVLATICIPVTLIEIASYTSLSTTTQQHLISSTLGTVDVTANMTGPQMAAVVGLEQTLELQVPEFVTHHPAVEEQIAQDEGFIVLSVITALRYIIFGTIPWMICCSTINFNVKRSYKVVILQILMTVGVALFLAIAIVNSDQRSKKEMILTTAYIVCCTLAPLLFIAWNLVFRWKSQTQENENTRKPMYSSGTITLLWALLLATFVPADIIRMIVILVKADLLQITDIVPSSISTIARMEEYIAYEMPYIAIFAKYLFVGLFPLVLLTSKQYRNTLRLELRKRKESFQANVSCFGKAIKQRSSVVSCSSASSGVSGNGPRCYSVVLNKHSGCLTVDLNQVVPCVSILDIPKELPKCCNSGATHQRCQQWCDTTQNPCDTTQHPGDPAPPAKQDLDQKTITNFTIDLHVLHAIYDETCDQCRMSKEREMLKRKAVKLKVSKLLSDKTKPKNDKTKPKKSAEKYAVPGVAEIKKKSRRYTLTNIGSQVLKEIPIMINP